MKLLLTSGGIQNSTIRHALTELLGQPIAESTALFIPTAKYGHPGCTPETVWYGVTGSLCNAGWKSVGMLELTALPSIAAERWVSWVRNADVLLADGGDATYLCHWMRQSGLADLLPSLDETVWVGMSAGSMVMTPRIGDEFVAWPDAASDETLGIVDFSIFPHLDYPDWPDNTLDSARRWATKLPGAAYAIDDETAISVAADGSVDVVSEGHWELLKAH
ncbi:Type 1 glutamine amidotransferase-like domain-containing protein [Microlunatus speluncae]|uniref:Type 1 glutamine amidotransferase-like domain-containing protein n=1 Tax=Microlunatus speluncae TaxID=2594267 RepID=UPI0012665DE8|nr:Type 1 glutamine amidotransferase-like domain-containing protein [Microlunatus speluncae]